MSIQGFWGLEVEPGKSYSQEVPAQFRVTMAALTEDIKKNQRTTLYVAVDDKEFALCSLVPEKHEQQPLDLSFSEGEKLTFTVRGANTIHLTGNYVFDIEDESDGENDDGDKAELIDFLKKKGLIDQDAEIGSEDEEIDSDDVDMGEAHEDEEESEEESEEEEEEEEKEEEEESEEESEEEEDEEEEEEEEETPAPAKKEKKRAAEPSKEQPASKKQKAETQSKAEQQKKQQAEAKAKAEQQKKQQTEVKAKTEKQKRQTEAKTKPEQDKKKQVDAKAKAEAKPVAKADQEKEKQAETKAKTDQEKKKQAETKAKAEQEKKQKAETKDKEKKKEEKTVQKLANGLIIEDIKKGQGATVAKNDRVYVRYTGRLQKNNKIFDSNTSGKPFTFIVGRQEVITGWDLGVVGMQINGERRLTIPPKLAYGSRGVPPDISGNSTLIFDIKLVKIKGKN